MATGSNKNVEELWNILKLKLMDLRGKLVPQVKYLGMTSFGSKDHIPYTISL